MGAKLDSELGVITVPKLKEEVKAKLGVDMSLSALRTLLKKRMRLRWRRVSNNHVYVNSSDNIRLRQLFALELVEVMRSGKVLLNFDESVIRLTSGRCYSWARRCKSNQRVIAKDVDGLSMLVAVSSEGDIYL